MLIGLLPAQPVLATPTDHPNTYTNTGDFRKDIIGVAKTQIGYREGSNNDTKYGDWFGLSNNPWCAMFVSWCADQADIPESVFKRCARASPEAPYFNMKYYDSTQYTPNSGDLFFTKGFTHVGLVYYISGDYFYSIEGNSNGGGSIDGDGVVSNKRRIKDYYFAIPGYTENPFITFRYQLNGASLLDAEKTYDQYKILSSNGVNLRTEASTTGQVLLALPCNIVITVTESKSAGGYIWGKTTYNGKTGWCVISEDWTQKVGTTSVIPYKINSAGFLCDSKTGDLETLSVSTSTATPITFLTLSAIGMEKNGYTFAGWKIAQEKTITIANGGSLKLSQLTIDSSVRNTIIDLQAVWIPSKFTVSYNANGGSIKSDSYEIDSNSICYKSNHKRYYQNWAPNQTKATGLVNIGSFGLYRRGYTFKGWGTKPSGGTIYDQDQALAANEFYSDVLEPKSTVTLYAIWVPNTLSVQYHANGGTLESTSYKSGTGGIYKSNNTIFQQKWTYNQPQANGLVNYFSFGLKRTGYSFIGWSLKSSGGNVLHMDNVNLLPTDIYPKIQTADQTITLYAIWVSNSHQHVYKNYQYNYDAASAQNGTETGFCSCGASHIRSKAGTMLKNSATLYTDVEANAWYKQGMDYAITYGFLSGNGNGKLMPKKNMTRAEFVQILANLSGIDTGNKDVQTGFSDVKPGDWYAPAVKWASEKGIVAGTGNGKFSPNAYLTREQLCTLLVRYASLDREVSLHQATDYDLFTDEEKISPWAVSGVYTCSRAELIYGVNENEFGPHIHATRAQVASIVMRFHMKYMG